MTRTRLAAAAAVTVLLAAAPRAEAADQDFAQIERGRYIAVTADCVACHSAPGGKPYAGGSALQTPFGTLVAPNITPDRETGIGSWTEEDLRRTLQDGVGRGGKRLYPAMPYPAYTKMTDDDIHALWAYLQTLAPVRNQVDVNQLPFPFNVRLVMAGWNLLNFEPGRFKPDPQKSPEWNRGAYLVEALGHCGTCHTPKTMLGADDTGKALQGANLQAWYAPSITADSRKGIGGWTAEQLTAYLKTGANHQSLASGPMAEEIQNSSSRMTDADLSAIAAYLLDGKGSASGQGGGGPAPLAADDARMTAGSAIYTDSCMACHGGDGKGQTFLFPTLAGSGVVQADDPATLIRLVLDGSRAVATDTRPTGPAMPPLGWRLDDAQVAAVVTYIRNSWRNAAAPVGVDDVAKVRRTLAEAQ
ncbi:cytochrome c [Azospirillum picis]|uniref:Mono/diheme cytochrome c family protein n=1 Tax=Azospirillum picis TaxID=488438 RepID=A0ABU0MQB2_9PROT|nr:cytochrome c [Azospirillum picis]MBP2302044.1 mono/diheme cytochrome c family protein [Azospirillum picis]MDQ0535665.1 mono/diheme cytochrome c family protein [Azospirillum picis]